MPRKGQQTRSQSPTPAQRQAFTPKAEPPKESWWVQPNKSFAEAWREQQERLANQTNGTMNLFKHPK